MFTSIDASKIIFFQLNPSVSCLPTTRGVPGATATSPTFGPPTFATSLLKYTGMASAIKREIVTIFELQWENSKLYFFIVFITCKILANHFSPYGHPFYLFYSFFFIQFMWMKMHSFIIWLYKGFIILKSKCLNL